MTMKQTQTPKLFEIELEDGIIFDVFGTKKCPLSKADKAEILKRLKEFSQTPEAKELFEILKKGKHGGRIHLIIDPLIETSGKNFGVGVVVLSDIKAISGSILYHELFHECQAIKHPGLWNPKNYDTIYDYFKVKFISEAAAELNGLWFEVNHPPEGGWITSRACDMAKIKERLSKTYTGKSLKQEVFREYFAEHMRGNKWETFYAKICHKGACDGGDIGRETISYLKLYPAQALQELGLQTEDFQFARMAVYPTETWCCVEQADKTRGDPEDLALEIALTRLRAKEDYYDKVGAFYAPKPQNKKSDRHPRPLKTKPVKITSGVKRNKTLQR